MPNSFGLERSDEDAKWKLPEMQIMFGVSTSQADIVEGYEGSPDDKRDHWLMFLERSWVLYPFLAHAPVHLLVVGT